MRFLSRACQLYVIRTRALASQPTMITFCPPFAPPRAPPLPPPLGAPRPPRLPPLGAPLLPPRDAPLPRSPNPPVDMLMTALVGNYLVVLHTSSTASATTVTKASSTSSRAAAASSVAASRCERHGCLCVWRLYGASSANFNVKKSSEWLELWKDADWWSTSTVTCGPLLYLCLTSFTDLSARIHAGQCVRSGRASCRIGYMVRV